MDRQIIGQILKRWVEGRQAEYLFFVSTISSGIWMDCYQNSLCCFPVVPVFLETYFITE